MQVEALVCDADPAIHNGFALAFGNCSGSNLRNDNDDDNTAACSSGTQQKHQERQPEQQRSYKIIMCYFHVKLNVQSKYKFVNSRENKTAFLDDVAKLHLCHSEKRFDIGCALFVQKWKETEPEATRLIKKSFFKKNKNWYIGCAPRVPKHNNGMESFNSSLKRCQTEHQRQPLKQFLFTALAIVRQRSMEYIKDKFPFQTDLHIPDKLFTIGREMKSNFVHEQEKSNGEIDFYTFKSGIDKTITLADVATFNTAHYNSFDEFAIKAFDIWKITFPKASDKWKESICTCPTFGRDNICKHIIQIAFNLGIIRWDDHNAPHNDYDDEPLFSTKRGRPKRTTNALVLE